MPAAYHLFTALVALASVFDSALAYSAASFQQFAGTTCTGKPLLSAQYFGSFADNICRVTSRKQPAVYGANFSQGIAGVPPVNSFRSGDCIMKTINGQLYSFNPICAGNPADVPDLSLIKDEYVRLDYTIGDRSCSNRDAQERFVMQFKTGECVPNAYQWGQSQSFPYIIAKCSSHSDVAFEMCTDSSCTKNCTALKYNSQCMGVEIGLFPNLTQVLIAKSFNTIVLSPKQKFKFTPSLSAMVSSSCPNFNSTKAGTPSAATKQTSAAIALIAVIAAPLIFFFLD